MRGNAGVEEDWDGGVERVSKMTAKGPDEGWKSG
jgi:hypothetical protein